MRYIIKAYYTTGDSFKSYDTSEIVDYDWEDEEVARENAKAIVEHARTYSQENDYFSEKPDRAYKQKWWYKEPMKGFGGFDHIDSSMFLKLDNGEKAQYLCPWCGYFEHLNYVEVMVKQEANRFYV